MTKKLFIGVDVGGTKISAGLVKDSGKIINREKRPTPKNAWAKDVFSTIKKCVDEILDEENLRLKNISAIGIGIPGIIHPNGEIKATPNMKLAGINISKELQKRLHVPVIAGNDVNLGLLGEQWLGAAKNTSNVISLFVGTGLGGAAIIHNKLYIGSTGAAAEFGHLIIVPGGNQCTCGNKGCLESYVGRWAIERDIRKAMKKGEKTIISKLLENKNKPIKSKILKQALKADDKLTKKVLTQAATTLGQACVSLRHTFDPELIVLGGGVIQACGDFFIKIVRQQVKTDKFFSQKGCEVVLSQLEDDAIILGAAALAKQSLTKS